MRISACIPAVATVFVTFGLVWAQATAQERDDALYSAAKTGQPAVLRTLEELVTIESPTGDQEGITAIGNYLESRLRALGLSVTRSAAASGVVGDNIVGHLQGRGGGNVLLMAHMDTVHPVGTLESLPFRVDDGKAYGPGVADAKGGIAVILHALQLLKAREFQDFGSITVLFNTDEEQGSRGSSDLIQQEAAKADYVLSYEPTNADPEVFLLGTSGVGSAKVEIKGKPAHAGAAPERGVNALVEAADLIGRTLDIDDKEKGRRFNWTMASAGAVSNVIPDHASLNADIRYAYPEDFETVVAMLEERIRKQKLPEAEIALDISPGRPAFNAGDEGRALIDRARGYYEQVGGKIILIERTGGGTDAAFAAAAGKPVIESMGLPGLNYHSNRGEYIVVDSIPRRLYMSARLIMDLGRSK